MPRPNFKRVTFLCMQQLTNFPYIEEDFDALTNYELLCKVVEYLNEVIANENVQNESILELYNSFNDLKNYVDNYFDNLDVQEEINNKLDEMVEDGTLPTLIAQYIDNYLIVNVRNHGAVGDGETDDTTAINTAIQYAKTNNINKVFIPAGTYLVNGTIILTNKLNIYGAGKNQTQLLNGNDGITSIPMITTENYADLTEDIKYISLHDLNITSNGLRSVYDIVLHNISYSNIYNIYFDRLNIINNNATDLHGLLIERDTSCSIESVVNKIYNCQIRNGKIKLEYTTDNYIDKNEIWASNCQNCALELKRSFNNSITNNQFVGGFIYGCIYFAHDSNSPVNSGNKIVNNYFDGSYNTVNTTDAIHIATNIQDTLITNNLFYITKKNSIYVNDDYFIRRCIISNNIFQESNKLDNYYNDIYSINTSNEGNLISNNTFYNNNKTNKGYPINYVCTSSGSLSKSIISNNVVEYPSGYNTFTFNRNHIKLLNNSENLSYDGKCFITAQQTSSQAITSTSDLNITSTIKSNGTGITLSDNTFTIGSNSGITAVNVKANVLAYGTLNQNKEIRVLKNNNIYYINQFKPTTNNFNFELDTVVPVTSNDTIKLQIVAADDNTTTTVGSTSTNQVTISEI